MDLAKELRLSANKIGDEGAGKLAEALPHMTKLEETWLGSHGGVWGDHVSQCAVHTLLLLHGRTEGLCMKGGSRSSPPHSPQ